MKMKGQWFSFFTAFFFFNYRSNSLGANVGGTTRIQLGPSLRRSAGKWEGPDPGGGGGGQMFIRIKWRSETVVREKRREGV